jgi:hypothetical protein
MNTHGFNEAAINETFVDVVVRVLTAATSYALVAVTPRVLRRTVQSAAARASMALASRTLARAALVAQVSAQLTPVARAVRFAQALVRGLATVSVLPPAIQVVVSCTTAAVIALRGRRVAAEPIDSVVAAGVAARSAAITGAAVRVEPLVVLSVTPVLLVRSLAQLLSRASIDATPNSVKRVQFDEYAIEAQTFVVRYEGNVFYVR